MEATIAELTKIREEVASLLSLPVLSDVSDAKDPSFSSLTLFSAPGYEDAYRSLLCLRSGLGLRSGEIEYSTRQVSDLYEAWCFVKLVSVVVALSHAKIDSTNAIAVDTSGFKVKLKRGQRSLVRIKTAERTIDVSYNETFAGLTGDQRPDILLRFRHPGWPDIVVVFDAKYRIDASPEYLATFGLAGPPVDAVNALHRYRDAIVVAEADAPLGRPVVKGVALFPFNAEEIEFRAHRLFESLGVLGIGAIPFLPGQTEVLEDWLTNLLSLPVERLADPGPQFLAYESSRTRR